MKINKAILSLLLPVLMIQHVVAAPKKSKIPKRFANVTRKLRLNTLAIKKFIRQYKKPLMFSGVGVCTLAVGYLAYNKYYGRGASGVEEKPKNAISTKIKNSKLNPKNWGKKTTYTSQDDTTDELPVDDQAEDIDSGYDPESVKVKSRIGSALKKIFTRKSDTQQATEEVQENENAEEDTSE